MEDCSTRQVKMSGRVADQQAKGRGRPGQFLIATVRSAAAQHRAAQTCVHIYGGAAETGLSSRYINIATTRYNAGATAQPSPKGKKEK
jgi:hypothetical protein